MKIRIFIFLLISNTAVLANDSKEAIVDSQNQKQGDTIWLEEKISPTTRWLESLVKPLTVWMEQQINEPIADPITQPKQTLENNTDSVKQTGSNTAHDPAIFISAEQASNIAKTHIAGDILHTKLMPKLGQYRVKLISKLGEIHIIFIHAASGQILSPNSRTNSTNSKTLGPTSVDQEKP